MVQSKRNQSTTKTTRSGNSSPGSVDSTPVGTTVDLSSLDSLFGEVEDYAIFMLDPKGTILSWNRGAQKIKGYSAAEIIGKNYRIFDTTEDKEKNLSEQLLAEATELGQTSCEGWRVRKDGTRFWGFVTITALHNGEGSIRGYLKITRDLTNKKVAEDSYSNYVEELKLKNEALKHSEDRYHKMISEVIDYAIVLLDKDGIVLEWNKGAEKLKGYKAKDIVGKSFRLFYTKDEKDAGIPEDRLAEAIAKGSISHEGWRIKKDGGRFWGSVAITALHGDDGQIIGFSQVTRDLTAKKIAEDRVGNVLEELRQSNEQLKQSEERFHRMVAEVQDYAIILLDRTGNIQNWNTGAEFIKGYRAEEIVGKNFRVFYPPEAREANLPEKLLRKAASTGRALHEGWRLRKDGTRFWGSVVITALHDSEGEVTGYSKVTRDLTEKKKAEDTLKTTAAQLDLKNKTLERLNEELSSFTHVASHDIKEPLRKILTFAARIEEVEFEPDKSREFLSKIQSSARRLQNLIDDLLSYSQVSHDNGTFQKVDLNEICRAVLNDLEVPINEKSAVIDVDRLPFVYGVPHQLHQVFLNLLSNSLKFSMAGVPPQIEIRAEMIKGPDIPGDPLTGSNKYHHIYFKDNGIGFFHEDIDRIFEAFQRLNPSSAYTGSGIGLAIVKKVVENHNGVIYAEGEPGQGATFHLYLPRVKPSGD